jgi:ABC-type uncharacterized transport system ATPase subunit
VRLPPDTSKRDRRQVVAPVLEELKLTPHAKTRVDRLSGGQRKRASVVMAPRPYRFRRLYQRAITVCSKPREHGHWKL